MVRHIRLTLEDRLYIEKRLKEGVSAKKISLEMNRSPSTIFRDLRRCKGEYNGKEAHENTCHGFHPVDFTIIGKKFGMLTIQEYVGVKNRRTWWKAICDCGNEARISRKTLADKMSPKHPFNCGCLGKQRSYQRFIEPETSMLSKYHDLLNLIEKSDDCWYWKGYFNKATGVPMTSWNCKVRNVRRMMFEIFHTEENQSTTRVYASCGDRNCVRPEHVVAGQAPRGHYFN